MKILPMSGCQYNNNFEGNSTLIKKSGSAVQRFKNTNAVRSNGFRKSAFGVMATIGLCVLTLLGACKKDDNKPAVTENKDIVDFAFRDFVNLFNLDTIGPTKVLKHSYVLNDGDSLVERFNYSANPDELHAEGIYYYNGPDPFTPHEQPFTSVWTKTTYNGQDAVKTEYKYPWENAKQPKLPEPQEVIYVPGAEGDNAMKMYVRPGTGNCLIDVSVENNSAKFTLEDSMHFNNPFSVEMRNY